MICTRCGADSDVEAARAVRIAEVEEEERTYGPIVAALYDESSWSNRLCVLVIDVIRMVVRAELARSKRQP